MRKVVIATNNKNKVKQIEDILGKDKYEFLTLNEIGFYEDIVEDGKSYADNAKIKAKKVYDFNKEHLVIADDSGLEVFCLNNEPGIYSARYAGVGHDDEKNIEKLLLNLEGVREEDRGAKYVCVIACIVDDKMCVVAEGEVHGRITKEPRGLSGFGYDPIMYYPHFNKTFAEMSDIERNSISHRTDALKKLEFLLNKILK